MQYPKCALFSPLEQRQIVVTMRLQRNRSYSQGIARVQCKFRRKFRIFHTRDELPTLRTSRTSQSLHEIKFWKKSEELKMAHR